MRNRIATCGIGLALLAITGCSDHFPAVKAAGIAGQDMAKQGSALGASAEICRDANALMHGTSRCDDVEKQAVRWGKITEAMGAYSVKLAALADAKDVSSSDPVQAALAAGAKAKVLSLTSEHDSAIAAFAGAVVTVLSERYRAHVLDDAIGHTDPSLQRIVSLVKGEVDLRLGEIKRAESAIDKIADALQMGTAAPPHDAAHDGHDAGPAITTDVHIVEGTLVALALMRQDLERKAIQYTKLETAITAFGAAHAALAKHVGELNAELVVKEVVQIVTAAEAAVTSLSAGSTARANATSLAEF